MITAQDKILSVASKLGLSSLQYMQASTGAVYDVDTDNSGQLFSSAARHPNPAVTNINENQFEVNEALLVETVAFYTFNEETGVVGNLQRTYGSNTVVVFDLIIGNKRVMKDTPIFSAGGPYTFANTGSAALTDGTDTFQAMIPRQQVYMEGTGILIPPQVQWYVEYRLFNVNTGATVDTSASPIGCYLYGTKVLLNFNTSI